MKECVCEYERDRENMYVRIRVCVCMSDMCEIAVSHRRYARTAKLDCFGST